MRRLPDAAAVPDRSGLQLGKVKTMRNAIKVKRHIDSPRIEVVLIPDSAGTDINSGSALFDLWLVLHVPDGKPPVTVRVEGGPFDRGSAVDKLSAVWNFIGTKFAEPTAKLGINRTGSAEARRQS